MFNNNSDDDDLMSHFDVEPDFDSFCLSPEQTEAPIIGTHFETTTKKFIDFSR